MNLAELFRRTKGDVSYDTLAGRYEGPPSSARLQQIATMPLLRFPNAETLVNIARALDVPVREVVLAAAESLGLDVSGSGEGLASVLPPSAADLNERQVAAVRAVISAMNPAVGGALRSSVNESTALGPQPAGSASQEPGHGSVRPDPGG